jgi:uncharacterized protein (UPF0332 family)
LFDLQDCIEKGSIKKIPASLEQAKLSTTKASEVLSEARANLEEERFNSAGIMAYVSILNSARALIFKDGYREKSHFCVARYIETHYGDKLALGMIHKLDAYRETRHEIQYSATHNATETEAKEMVEFAGEFLEKIEEIIEEKEI